MAPDDRDRMFDKALSRHLRYVTSSPAATKLSSDPGPQSSSCLDPEILAAYHERSLLPDEMNSAKEHIVGCAHCQAILAQLKLTDTISLAAVEKEKVPLTVAAPAVIEQEQLRASAAQAPPPQKTISPRHIRGPRWHWLVPAGALAAGLLVWVGLHESQQPHLSNTNEVRVVAKAQESPPPLPAFDKRPLPAVSSPKPEQLDELGRTRGLVAGTGGAVSKTIPAPQANLKLAQRPDSPARLPSAVPSPVKESELPKDEVRDSSGSLIAAEKQSGLDAKNAPAGALQDQTVLQNQAANIQTQNQILSQKAVGPSALGQAAEPTKKAKSASAASRPSSAVPPPPPAPSSVAAFTDLESANGRAIPNQHLIATPSSPVRWLAGRAGLIEFSADNGASWSLQTSGVAVDLLTGSAPTDKICWMVGRAGTVLLTSDGGAHWSVIHSPLTEDLGGVRASDALHATIWNLLNTKTFETSDGGITWKPVPAP